MTSESTDGSSRRLFSPYLLGGAVCAALAVWLTAPLWGPSPPAGDDVPAHVVRAEFAFRHIFGAGHADGWFSRFMVGHQEFLLYGPGFTWLLGALRLATGGTLSTVGAVKVAGAASYIGIVPAATFLARSFGVSRAGAVAAGLLALAVNSPFGVGPHAVYVIGLLPHQVAAVLFCVALGAATRAVRLPGRRWVVVTAIAFGLLAATHVISAVIAAVFLALVVGALLAGGDATPGWWRRLPLAGALAAGLAALWLVPFAVHRDLRGPVTAWSTPSWVRRMTEILGGDILLPAGLGLVCLAAVVVAIWSAPRALALVAAVPIVYLFVAHTLLAASPSNVVAIQLPNRGVGYAGLLALVPVGFALSHLDELAARSRRIRPPLAASSVVVIAAGATFAFTFTTRDLVRERRQASPALLAAAAELRERVPDGSRFATERDFPAEVARTGVTHPDLWLAALSGRDTLNLFNPESSPSAAGFVSEEIGQRTPARLARELGRYGVSHVVTLGRTTAARLAADHSFQRVWRRDNVAVFELRAPGRVGPFHAPGLVGSVSVAEPERVVATMRASAGGRKQVVSAAVSWSPKWEVRVDGDRVEETRSGDSIIEFALPPKRSQVELTFHRDGWDAAGVAVSATTTVGLVAYLSLSVSMSSLISRRRSRTA